ncbi:MAG: head GIN domain-containing protein [Chitinophagaceae bacterium]
MKKILFSILFMTLTGGLLFGQKTISDPTAEKRNVSGFHGIEVGTGIELLLTEGPAEQVAVSAASSEYRDKIVTKVENGILKIYYDSKLGSVNKKKEDKDLKAYVSYKILDMLDATTGAEVKIEGVLKSSSLNLKANTGALVNGEVSVTSLKVDQNTGSRISLSGKADKLEIEGSTGSRFKGEDMISSNCNVTVSTGAIVSVQAEKELQVKANTGGSVKYKGNATVREFKTNTGGSVSKI